MLSRALHMDHGIGQTTDVAVLCSPAHRHPGVQRSTCRPLHAEGFGVLTDIGLLLPCNVVVREAADGRLLVAFMDPVAVLQLTSNPEIAVVARDVRQRLERVRASLGRGVAVPG